MKKNYSGFFIVLVSFIFLIFSCKKSNYNNYSSQINNIGPSDLPSSDAKTFVSTKTDADKVVKTFFESINGDSYFKNCKKSHSEFLKETKSVFNGEYGDKKYFEELKSILQTSLNYAKNKNLSKSFSCFNSPGVAKLEAEGYEVNVPSFYFSINRNGDDLFAKINGSAFFSTPTSNFCLKDFSININNSSNSKVSNEYSDFYISLSEKYPGVLFEIPYLNLKFLQTSVKENNNNILKNNSEILLKGSSYIVLDTTAFSEESIFKKAIFSSSFDLKPNSEADFFNTTDLYSAEGELEFNAGVSFLCEDGMGGKIVIASTVTQENAGKKLNKKNKQKISKNEIVKAYEKEKYTKTEFNRIGIPIQVYLNISFYNDENIKTLDYLTVRNLYDLYSIVYDILEASKIKENAACYIDTVQDKKQYLSFESILNFFWKIIDIN